jgi:monofunctional biosynthetic peptidoglycan transglycosylase
MRRVLKWIFFGLTLLLLLLVVVIEIYRFVRPPITPLMVIRGFQGQPTIHQWIDADAIAPDMFRAIIASEDAKFCRHHGFDWQAMDEDFERSEEGEGKVRGASTISMQTAKNLFLWPGRTFLRKGLEAPLTVLIEALLPKKRIIEIYLNIIEWGPGIYGVEAASQAAFHHSARTLSRREAALLAAVVPSPLKSSASHPSAYIERRVGTIEARMESVPFQRQRICGVAQDPLW